MRKTVALQEPGEGAADWQPVIFHGGEYENLVEVEGLRKQTVELDVGENAAGESQMPRRIIL
jgi:hypothetical protein